MNRLLIIAVFTVLSISSEAASLGYNYNSGQFQSIQNLPPPQVEHTKSFYFFSAPEDNIPKSSEISQITSKVKKHHQVVFIKAPENNGYTNAALSLARQAAEAKTHIYVLSKEPDVVDLQQQIHDIRNTNAQKPEVTFVRYRTPEDAYIAEQAIKSRYENLRGENGNSLTEAATVLDSSATGASDDDDLFTAGRPPFLPTGVDVVPGSSYLPPRRD